MSSEQAAASAPPKGSAYDPSKITGPYALMGAIVLALEVLLGFWLFRAEDSTERITVGVLMTLILGGILLVVTMLHARREKEAAEEAAPAEVPVPGVVAVDPARRDASPVEAAQPKDDVMAGPDRSYLIRRPPVDWTTIEINNAEFVAALLGVHVSTLPEEMQQSSAREAREILMFRSHRNVTITPQPGKTRIDGRAHLTALQVPLAPLVTVLPLDRRQPPLYMDRPFEHNFHHALGALFNSAVVTLQKIQESKTPTGRRRIDAYFQQELTDVLVNGQHVSRALLVISVIGIECDVRDQLLFSRYVTVDAPSPQLDADLATLKGLVDSFQPIALANAAAARAQYREKTDGYFRQWLEANGVQALSNELGAFSLRVKSANLTNPGDRQRIMEGLAPFEAFAREVGADDYDELWEALHTAERGDASRLIVELGKLVKRFEGEAEPEATQQQLPA